LRQIEIETQKNIQNQTEELTQQKETITQATKFSFSTLLSSTKNGTGTNSAGANFPSVGSGSIKLKKSSQAFQFLKNFSNQTNEAKEGGFFGESEDFFDANQILNSLDAPAVGGGVSRRLSLPHANQQNQVSSTTTTTTTTNNINNQKSTAKRLFMNLINSVTQNIHHTNNSNSSEINNHQGLSNSPMLNSNKTNSLRKIQQLQNGATAQRRLSDYHRPVKASVIIRYLQFYIFLLTIIKSIFLIKTNKFFSRFFC
jgi:hypothetical protein